MTIENFFNDCNLHKDDLIFLDCESVGLHGMPVLLQLAVGDGEVFLYSIWKHKVSITLNLIRKIVYHQGGICGFNLAFDWFHLAKIYTTLLVFKQRFGNLYPDEHIDDVACCEMEARDGPCLKPRKALDLMLHARKGPYQSLMNRDDIRIRRVPTTLAWELAAELKKRVPLDDIFFARSKDGFGVDRFKVFDIKDEDGDIIPHFKDIVCKFSPSTALKALAVHALGVKEDQVLKFKDIECNMYPEEHGYAPFAMAVGKPGAWNNAWPHVIEHHIRHWAYNDLARQYAGNDIVYTRGLYKHFGRPESNDDDSILACMVAVVRWRGLRVNIDGIKELRAEAIGLSQSCVKDGARVKDYLKVAMDEIEYLTIQESTKKAVLEDIIKNWKINKGTPEEAPHPVVALCKNVLAARRAKKEVELYDKLILAGRFHCSFVVIGTKSSRMSGNNGLNPQGINHTKKVRSQFPFAWDDLLLCGGDFSSFEVSLAAAVYNDPKLNEDLQATHWKEVDRDCKEHKKWFDGKKPIKEEDGKVYLGAPTKMACLFGEAFFPDLDYDEILETDGEEVDHYDTSKRGMYQFFYGGTAPGMAKKLGFAPDVAENALEVFQTRYQGVGRERKFVEDMFCSMKQEGGIGTKITWRDPCDYVESPLKFRRYFTLENRICKALFNLAEDPPAKWRDIKVKVVRRDRMQTASGATQSALFGAAFSIQASNTRAGLNHRIQCWGSQLTKQVQVTVWEFQPFGICDWVVMPFNCHDEIDAPCIPHVAEYIKNDVLNKIETFRPDVPLIKMQWDIGLTSWKSKG